MRKIAIGDIHGCNLTFEALLDKLALTTQDQLFLLGDYIDRGPDSKGVIDIILKLQEDGYQVNCLRGNHEQLLLDSNFRTESARIWLSNGGVSTMDSFDIEHISFLPDRYFNFFKNLPHYFIEDDFILVHAGLNFRLPDPLEDKHSMLWSRNWYPQIDEQWLGRKKVIHGHTPTKRKIIEDQLLLLDQLRYLNLDSGCVFDRLGLHWLCAFDMTNRELIFQKNVEF